MRKTVIFPCLLGLVASLAASPSASAKVIRPQRIPAAKLAKTPTEASKPKTISSGARVAGIVAASGPAFMRGRGGPPMKVILPSKAAARTFNRSGDRTEDPNPVCFTTLHGGEIGGRPFPTQHDIMPSIWAESAKRGRVSVVRRERFVEGAGESATLVVTDAYVDAVSGGAKLIGESRVALARVATGPQALAVYAAKEGSWVHFVVMAPKPDPVVARFVGALPGLELLDTTRPGNSSCRFLRTSLRADGPGGGQAATVRTRIAVDVQTEEPAPEPTTKVERLFGRKPSPQVQHEVTMRLAAVRLSVSQTKADRQPVVSVAFGWEGETERFAM